MEAWLVDVVDTLCAGLELSGIYDPSRLRRRLGVEPSPKSVRNPPPLSCKKAEGSLHSSSSAWVRTCSLLALSSTNSRCICACCHFSRW